MNQLIKAINAGVLTNCNIEADYTACIVAHWDNTNAVKFQWYDLMMTSLPYITGVDYCTWEALDPYYYNLEQEYNSYGSAAVVVVALGLMALV